MSLTNNEKTAMRYYIRSQASYASCLEMLGEESSEVTQAALKLARYRRGEQPVAFEFDGVRAEENLLEELADILVSAYVSGLMDGENEKKIRDIFDEKLERWYNRMRIKNSPNTIPEWHER